MEKWDPVQGTWDFVPTGTPGNPLEPRTCQTSEMDLLRKLLPATGTNSESCQTSMMEVLCFVYFDISIAIIRYIYIYSF